MQATNLLKEKVFLYENLTDMEKLKWLTDQTDWIASELAKIKGEKYGEKKD